MWTAPIAGMSWFERAQRLPELPERIGAAARKTRGVRFEEKRCRERLERRRRELAAGVKREHEGRKLLAAELEAHIQFACHQDDEHERLRERWLSAAVGADGAADERDHLRVEQDTLRSVLWCEVLRIVAEQQLDGALRASGLDA